MWGNPHVFPAGKDYWKKIWEKISIDIIEKSFLIDSLNTDNAVYR